MCWYCGSPIQDAEPIGRSLRCETCGKDLKSCRNCRFYLSGSRSGCSEPGADPPSESDRANFCGWFKLDPRYREPTAGQTKDLNKAASAKSAFNDLFK